MSDDDYLFAYIGRHLEDMLMVHREAVEDIKFIRLAIYNLETAICKLAGIEPEGYDDMGDL